MDHNSINNKWDANWYTCIQNLLVNIVLEFSFLKDTNPKRHLLLHLGMGQINSSLELYNLQQWVIKFKVVQPKLVPMNCHWIYINVLKINIISS